MVNGLFLTTDWCSHAMIGWTISSDVPLAGVTLVHGDRRVELQRKGKQFEAPIGDLGWPDDTRIELRIAE
jgi:hypothetical protein